MSMFLKKMKKNRKGYTLTELIVVVAILGILAAVATPMVLNQIDNAKAKTDITNAKAIENAYKIALVSEEISKTENDVTVIKPAIEKTLKPIPTPQQKPGYFVLNITTSEVTFATTSGAIDISSNP